MSCVLQDTGETVRFGERTFYEVDRMISMHSPNPQPPKLWFGNFANAVKAAVDHCLSEPWRKHAQVWIFPRDGGSRRVWLYNAGGAIGVRED